MSLTDLLITDRTCETIIGELIANPFLFSMPAGVMPRRCCIRDCNRETGLKYVPSGKFDATIRKKWLMHCRENTNKLKYAFVCSIHFSQQQWVDVEGKKCLKDGSVPDQHLPG